MMLGVGLLLLPTGTEPKEEQMKSQTEGLVAEQDLEREMEEILGVMSGVGQVKVLLTLETDGEMRLAQDTELNYRGDSAAPEDYSRRSEIVLVDDGSGDTGIVTQTMKPVYRGALVVCQGGGQPEIKLAVTEAVAVLTGLSADRITVAKWQ
jgi:stage III sporulation protein AG